MNTMLDVFQHPAMTALAWTLIHFLWQGALLGAAAFAALQILRPERATTRYAISVATLAAMVVACAITFAIAMRQQPVQSQRAISVAAESSAPVVATPPAARQLVSDQQAMSAAVIGPSSTPWQVDSVDANLLMAIVIAWLIGVAAMSIRLAGGWVLTRRLATRAAVAVPPVIEHAARSVARRLNVRRTVSILESSLVAVPTLIGWLKPVVLLPTAALAGLSPDQLRAILAHELAHVRRHDYLVNLLQSVVETLLFYHPATWWVSAQIRAEREHCCDDLAIDVCGDRLVYVSALAELTALSGAHGLALAATDGSLVSRVRRILGGDRSTNEPAPLWPVFALVMLVVGAASFSADATDQNAGGTTVTSPNAAAPVGDVAAPAEQAAPEAIEQSAPSATATAAPDEQIEAVNAAQADARRAEAANVALIAAQLREQAEMLAAEAARLRAEADRIRQEEIEMRNWTGQPTDAPPPPPPAPPPPPPSASARAEADELRRDRAEAASGREGGQPGMRGSGNMVWSNNGESVSLKWTGPFRLNDDETDIEWIENGVTVTVGDGGLFATRVELRGTANGIERRFSRNGRQREYEPEGRDFLKAAIDRLIRSSGAFAKERVARFLKRGGPDAVLSEIDRLDDSSHVRRVYYSELLTQAVPMTESLLDRVIQRAATQIDSDHEKATLFIVAASLPALSDRHRIAIARAAGSINSDHEQRRTLTAIMNVSSLQPAVSTAIVEATASMGSNHERAETLITVIERRGLTDASANAFFDSASQIESAHELGRVLRRAVADTGVTDRVLGAVLKTAAKVSSSHERANVLIDVAVNATIAGGQRQLYVAATKGLGQHDETRAMAALARAEARQ